MDQGNINKKGFTLVELLVVIMIIMVVTGMSVPLMNKFFENQRMPRAAKVLATHVRNAQITAVNYLMETQIEIAPGTANQVRIWGYSAQVKNPSSWDTGHKVMITESRRLSKRGGKIRFLPLNQYSLQPQNSKDYKTLSGNEWEFCELKYINYTMQACYRTAYDSDTTDDWKEWEVTPELIDLIYSHTGNSRGSGIGQSNPVGVQLLLSTSHLPTGTGVDTVNYVSYYDANEDGMPDGNPLALRWDTTLTVNNRNFPLIIPAFSNTIDKGTLYKNINKRIPNKISGGLMFSKEGTLKRSLSLHYLSVNPLNMTGPKYFVSGKTVDAARVYGFVVYDRGSNLKRMMVEVTGIGQVRQPYGIFTPNKQIWGDNFNPSSETGG